MFDAKTNTLLYSSRSTTAPIITTRWARTLSPCPNNEAHTLVDEVIRGQAPVSSSDLPFPTLAPDLSDFQSFLKWVTERETRNSHADQMALYHTLFDASPSPPTLDASEERSQADPQGASPIATLAQPEAV